MHTTEPQTVFTTDRVHALLLEQESGSHSIALTAAAEFAGREHIVDPDAPSIVSKSCTRQNSKLSSRLARVHALLLEQEGYVAGLLVTSQTCVLLLHAASLIFCVSFVD